MYYFFLCLIVALAVTEDLHYQIVGINEQGELINGCNFSCFESNCSQTAITTFACPNCSWIAFVPDARKCTVFDHNLTKSRAYVVWGIDQDQHLIPQTIKQIDNYFSDAVNYGCALMRWHTDAMWFGMLPQMNEPVVFSSQSLIQ
jgi:hypothetical protein